MTEWLGQVDSWMDRMDRWMNISMMNAWNGLIYGWREVSGP